MCGGFFFLGSFLCVWTHPPSPPPPALLLSCGLALHEHSKNARDGLAAGVGDANALSDVVSSKMASFQNVALADSVAAIHRTLEQQAARAKAWADELSGQLASHSHSVIEHSQAQAQAVERLESTVARFAEASKEATARQHRQLRARMVEHNDEAQRARTRMQAEFERLLAQMVEGDQQALAAMDAQLSSASADNKTAGDAFVSDVGMQAADVQKAQQEFVDVLDKRVGAVQADARTTAEAMCEQSRGTSQLVDELAQHARDATDDAANTLRAYAADAAVKSASVQEGMVASEKRYGELRERMLAATVNSVDAASSVAHTRVAERAASDAAAWRAHVDQHVLEPASRAEEAITAELGAALDGATGFQFADDVPTGRTPTRKHFEYPRDLEAMRPYPLVLEEFHEQRKAASDEGAVVAEHDDAVEDDEARGNGDAEPANVDCSDAATGEGKAAAEKENDGSAGTAAKKPVNEGMRLRGGRTVAPASGEADATSRIPGPRTRRALSRQKSHPDAPQGQPLENIGNVAK